MLVSRLLSWNKTRSAPEQSVPSGEILAGLSDRAAVRTAPSPDEALYEVRSETGGRLALDHLGRIVHHPIDNQGTLRSLVGMRHPLRPRTLFLTVAQGAETLVSVLSDPIRLYVMPYTLIEHPDDGSVSLLSPRNGMFVSAVPVSTDHVTVNCDRPHAHGWERFRLAPATDDVDRIWIGRVASALRELPDGPLDAGQLVGWIEQISSDTMRLFGREIVQSCPSPILDAALEALEGPKLDQLMETACSEDIWFDAAWRPLCDWVSTRDQARKIVIGPILDQVTHDDVAGSACRRVVTRARGLVQPRHDVAVMTVVHNDGPYIMEWVAHHRALGAAGIFIYSISGEDNSETLLEALADEGLITWIKCENGADVSARWKANTHFLSCLPQSLDYRWSLIIDIEEFVVLNLERYQSLADFARQREEQGATVVALSRLIFIPGGQASWSRRPLAERFTTRLPVGERSVKSMFLTRNVIGSHSGEPIVAPGVDCVYHKASGALHHWPGRRFSASQGDPVFGDAWINIYRIKSIDEVIWEENKSGLRDHPDGHVALGPADLLRRIQDRAREPTVNDAHAMAHLPGLLGDLDALRSLPSVAEAEDVVLCTFSHRLNLLKSRLQAEMQDDPILRGVAATWLRHDISAHAT